MAAILFQQRLGAALAVLLFAVAWTLPSSADGGPSARPTRKAFEALALRLAAKVPLFQTAWEDDPRAAFFGGTVRDYLLWLAGKLDDGCHRGELTEVVAALEARAVIDHREFLGADSDVDVFSSRGVPSLDASRLGIQRVDVRSPSALDPRSGEAETHRDQGYLPAEKLVLTRDALRSLDERLGDGIEEIRTGRYTVHFADEETFWKSHFAAKGWNHPVFLALRYVRLLAADAYHRRQTNRVGLDAIRPRLDAASMEATGRVLASAAGDPKLLELARDPRFHQKLDATIQRAFSGYCDATVASQLHRHFDTTRLFRWVGKLTPIHQHLFARRRDPEALLATWKAYGVVPERFFKNRNHFFPDHLLHHGTRTDDALRDIAVRGILPSETGTAGAGLYGTSRDHVKHILPIYAQNDPDRIVRFQVLPSATIVDVTEGHGREVFERWKQGNYHASLDDFCDAFGIDVLRYDYEFPAFVVKNARALGPPQTTTARRSLSDLLDDARSVHGAQELETLLRAARSNRVDRWELGALVRRTPYAQRFPPASEHRAFLRVLLGERLTPEAAHTVALAFPGSPIAQAVTESIQRNHWLGSTRESLERFALALCLWNESRDDGALATAIVDFAMAAQASPVSPATLVESLSPIRALVPDTVLSPALAEALAEQQRGTERRERRKVRRDATSLIARNAGAALTVAGAAVAVTAGMFGFDWLMTHAVGLGAWHTGVFVSGAAAAMLGVQAKMSHLDKEEWLIAGTLAGIAFAADLPAFAVGHPEWSAGIATSVVSLLTLAIGGFEATKEVREDVERLRHRAEAARESRDTHVQGVRDALERPVDSPSCADALNDAA